ncbi:SDR family NAD(P)-dependent oxidoreductase [Chloroflexota bacterium]
MRYPVNGKKKVAIVTGASRGIGKAIAIRLAESGADIAVLARTYDELNTVSSRIQEIGCKSMVLTGDVTKYSRIAELFTEVYQAFGSIDILVNNAGINSRKGLEMLDECDWDTEIDTNLKGVFICCKAAAEFMKKQGRGWIINISSVKGKEATTSMSYGASKAGVIGLSRSLAKQLIPFNIYVNCVAPGFINTGMSRLLSPSEVERYLREIPIGRMGEPEDIAEVVCFLASPAASYIVGATINVNGGYLMD